MIKSGHMNEEGLDYVWNYIILYWYEVETMHMQVTTKLYKYWCISTYFSKTFN